MYWLQAISKLKTKVLNDNNGGGGGDFLTTGFCSDQGWSMKSS